MEIDRVAKTQQEIERAIPEFSHIRQRPGVLVSLSKSLMRDKTAMLGFVLVLLAIFCALLAPYLAPHAPSEQNLRNSLRPPVWEAGGLPEHPLGTDHLGRDILSRVIYGSRVSLIIGFGATVLGAVLGSVLGLVSGYSERWIGEVVMRLVDIQFSVPAILLAVALAVLLRPSVFNVILIFTVSGYPLFARVVRSEVLAIKERDYVESARCIGASSTRILFRHVLPNIWNLVIVVSSLQVGALIIAEAGLGFLGLSVPPNVPSWGNMLSNGRDFVSVAWWLATFPGLAITITVLGVNFVGDWLRDVLDPRRVQA